VGWVVFEFYLFRIVMKKIGVRSDGFFSTLYRNEMNPTSASDYLLAK